MTRLLSRCTHTSPTLCSLYGNKIGDEGVSALAAVLKETQITKLECAAALERLLLCQRLLTCTPLRPPHRSLGANRLDDQAKQAVRDSVGCGVSIKL